MSDLQLPLLQLFQRLRQAGMKLTIEHYESLRQALDQGFGLDWESLERVCRLLWVKPSLNYDEAVFHREFNHFRITHQQAFDDYWASRRSTEVQIRQVPLGVLPIVPPRRSTQQNLEEPLLKEPRSLSDKPTSEDGLGAIDLPDLGKPMAKNLRFEPWDMPISLEQVLQTWKRLRRPVLEYQREEFDLDATIERMNRDGFLHDLVMRPLVRKVADLLLLVDEGSGMVPYAPVWRPWVQAVEEQRIAVAQVYQFSCAVSDALYDWYQPLQAVSISSVLMRLHPQRSVVVILSDVGAATRSNDVEKVESMQKLLQQLGRSAREVIWLNPVPECYWADTSAKVISQWIDSSSELQGVMLPFDLRQWWERLPLAGSVVGRSSGKRGVVYAN